MKNKLNEENKIRNIDKENMQKDIEKMRQEIERVSV